MSTPTLASMSSLLAMLPERDNATTVSESIHAHLTNATALIEEYTGVSFEAGDTTLFFDTYQGYSPTAFVSPPTEFARAQHMSVDLPVRGPLPSLSVTYKRDQRGVWDEAERLQPGNDYIHDEQAGRIRFLRSFRDRVQGLRVDYSTTGTLYRDIMVGEGRNAALSETGIQSLGIENLPNVFNGILHKATHQCAIGLGTCSFTLQPPTDRAIASVTLYSPRDEAMADPDVPLLLSMGSSTVHASSPLPRSLYTLRNQEGTGGPQTIQLFSGGGKVAVSFVDVTFYHPTWVHAEGSVPPQVSQACALLATLLYQRVDLDGVGRTEDRTGRSYRGTGSIPTEVREMLRPFIQGKSAITMI